MRVKMGGRKSMTNIVNKNLDKLLKLTKEDVCQIR